jgi:hypothetical protein
MNHEIVLCAFNICGCVNTNSQWHISGYSTPLSIAGFKVLEGEICIPYLPFMSTM